MARHSEPKLPASPQLLIFFYFLFCMSTVQWVDRSMMSIAVCKHTRGMLGEQISCSINLSRNSPVGIVAIFLVWPVFNRLSRKVKFSQMDWFCKNCRYYTTSVPRCRSVGQFYFCDSEVLFLSFSLHVLLMHVKALVSIMWINYR